MTRRLLFFTYCLLSFLPIGAAVQGVSSVTSNHDEELKFVVYLSRHGVRSPTSDPSQHNLSVAPWPTWDVPPGYLTAHGYHLMELFGAYDRVELAKEGLFREERCADATRVTIYADSDQRTRETGKALAAGMFPGCSVMVQARPEGVNDPLFHPHWTGNANDSALASAAIAGRIGGDPVNIIDAYRTQLSTLDTILATCGTTDLSQHKRLSLFDLPATLSPGTGDHMVDLHSPLGTASSLVEDFLLEYAQGMDASNVGWGCVDGTKLRALMDLHTAASDISLRTPMVARVLASNLLDHIDRALQQAVTQKTVVGALSKPSDRALFLIGHDTNLSTVSGLLDIDWIADGRRDDTPPGGALIFELWKNRATNSYSVRTYFTVQTLEQMRSSATLTLDYPPQRVPIFIPGCSGQDFSCTWTAFQKTIRNAIDSKRIKTGL